MTSGDLSHRNTPNAFASAHIIFPSKQYFVEAVSNISCDSLCDAQTIFRKDKRC